MKVIVAGSRQIFDVSLVDFAIDKARLFPSEIVCGGARGADESGQVWAWEKGIRVEFMPADWDKNGKAAGPIRNRQMADYGDACIVIWDGESRGSFNMIREAIRAEIPLFVVTPNTFDGIVIGAGFPASLIGKHKEYNFYKIDGTGWPRG